MFHQTQKLLAEKYRMRIMHGGLLPRWTAQFLYGSSEEKVEETEHADENYRHAVRNETATPNSLHRRHRGRL